MFAELDRASTRMGEISLRRRRDPSLDVDVFEVKLEEEFLMSSLFTVAETELANLALARVGDGHVALHVVVGGLGLGYTAAAVLDDRRVRRLDVVEALRPVISWHERGLVPLGQHLTTDERCHLVEGDFFDLAARGLLPGDDRLVDAVLVDIDHTPRHWLHGDHAAFYSRDGLERLVSSLRPAGVFGLWSDAAPDDAFLSILDQVFASATAEVVTFPNPYTGGESSNTVYVAVASS